MDPHHKQPLRQQLLADRRGLDPIEVQQASAAIAKQMGCLPEVQAAQTIGLYKALKNEIGMKVLWETLVAAGKRVLFPRIVAGSRVLAFAPVDDPAELVVGALGISQPPEGMDVPLAEIDILVVPALAFDLDGQRLGRGGGYYDATLAAAPAAWRIGPCLEGHVLLRLPSESHDEPVDAIVTPERVIRPRWPGRGNPVG